MLVPESEPQRLSRRGTEETMPTPGAVTSGFSASETGVGPAEEKSAMTSAGTIWRSQPSDGTNIYLKADGQSRNADVFVG